MLRKANLLERFLALLINIFALGLYLKLLRKLPLWMDPDMLSKDVVGFSTLFLLHVFVVGLYIWFNCLLRGSIGHLVLGLKVHANRSSNFQAKYHLVRNLPVILFLIGIVGPNVDRMNAAKGYFFLFALLLSISVYVGNIISLMIKREQSIIDLISKTELLEAPRIFKRPAKNTRGWNGA